MKIAYIGALRDMSGYAEAARNNIAAILNAGVEVDAVPLSFENFDKGDMGELGDLINKRLVPDSDAPIRIVHTVPLSYQGQMKKDAYNIGYTTWEADRIPPDWVFHINAMDEVWVPCNQNVDAFRRSGVDIPIFVMPHTFDTTYANNKLVDTDELPAISQLDDYFVFYSIFQWLERKNPLGLLKAYLTSFEPTDKVALIMKTYMSNPNNVSEANRLKQYIFDIKNLLRLEDYPKVFMITNLLSREQIELLHRRGDCYVHLARCEGFGQPITEAMLAGNPVVACGYGGPQDYIEHGKTGYLVDYQMTPVYGMPWNTYTARMNWADPDITKAKEYMQTVYHNRDKGKEIGRAGFEYIKTQNSWETIGKLMVDRLKKIEEQKLWITKNSH